MAINRDLENNLIKQYKKVAKHKILEIPLTDKDAALLNACMPEEYRGDNFYLYVYHNEVFIVNQVVDVPITNWDDGTINTIYSSVISHL